MQKRQEMLKIAAVGIGVLVVLAAITSPAVSALPVPPGEEAIYYLEPDNSSAPGYCNTATVQLRVNSTRDFCNGKISISHNPLTCGNITGITFDSEWEDTADTWQSGKYITNFFNMVGSVYTNVTAGDYLIGNLTLHCNSTIGCTTDLNFVSQTYLECVTTGEDADISIVTENGAFTCEGEGPETTFSKDLYTGWNLVSLPLTPSDNNTNSVLASVLENVTLSVYSYNATSKLFESASTMDTGVGYFVRITQNCTWTYSGTSAYDSMTTELKHGLNMIGWLNCTKAITGLTTIDGKHWYAARWNATEQEFETYNPVAPNGFNDFTAMDRGEGYFISAKEVTTLNENC